MAGIGAGITAKYGPAQQQGMEQEAPAGQPAVGMGEGGRQEASPQQEADAYQFIDKAIELTHDENGKPTEPVQRHLQGQFEPDVLQMFKAVQPPINVKSPSDCLALTGLLVVMATDASAMQAGKDVGPDVVFQAGAEIIANFAEDAEALGLFQSDEKGVQVAVIRANDIYNQIDGPRVDKEALASEFEQLVQADRDGQIDKVLPGAKQIAASAEQEQQPQQQGMMA